MILFASLQKNAGICHSNKLQDMRMECSCPPLYRIWFGLMGGQIRQLRLSTAIRMYQLVGIKQTRTTMPRKQPPLKSPSLKEGRRSLRASNLLRQSPNTAHKDSAEIKDAQDNAKNTGNESRNKQFCSKNLDKKRNNNQRQ